MWNCTHCLSVHIFKCGSIKRISQFLYSTQVKMSSEENPRKKVSFMLPCVLFSTAEDGANGDVEQVSAADVVLYGLDIIVPLMNIELLKVSYFG